LRGEELKGEASFPKDKKTLDFIPESPPAIRFFPDWLKRKKENIS